MVSRIFECPINVENKSHFSSMSASSNHLGHHLLMVLEWGFWGIFLSSGSQIHTLPQTPHFSRSLLWESSQGEAIVDDVIRLGHTEWLHTLESPTGDLSKQGNQAEGASGDLSLNSSRSLAQYLWTRRIPLFSPTRELWTSQAASYKILGLLWSFLSAPSLIFSMHLFYKHASRAH